MPRSFLNPNLKLVFVSLMFLFLVFYHFIYCHHQDNVISTSAAIFHHIYEMKYSLLASCSDSFCYYYNSTIDQQQNWHFNCKENTNDNNNNNNNSHLA